MNFLKTAAVASSLVFAGSMASAAVYDFQQYANSLNPEVGTLSYDTSSDFSGPSMTITASVDNTQDIVPAYVYFDSGNAGIGVCDKIFDPQASGSNQCDPSSDDGITKLTEYLTFTADERLSFDGIWMNNNHDTGSLFTDTAWQYVLHTAGGDTIFGPVAGSTFAYDPLRSGSNDYFWALGLELMAGDSITFSSTAGPNTYVSAISVSPVPVPAAGLLLLGGLGGMAAMRRRKRA